MSLAIPRRDTGHATAPLNPQVMSTATRHPRRRRRDCLRGECAQKNVRGYRRYFYHGRGKNCLDTQELAVPHEEEYWQTARK